MTTRNWGYGLLAVGLFMGFFRITTDSLFLTLVSFSVAIAGAFLIISPYRLRWLVLVFLVPAAAFGILSLIFVHKQIFLSIAWIGAAVVPVWQVFAETREQQASIFDDTTDDNDRNA